MTDLAATITPRQVQVAPGQKLDYVLFNTGAQRISFGATCKLEGWDGEHWGLLPRRIGSRLLRFSLAPGRARQLSARMPPRIRPGRYRLHQTVRLDDGSRSRRELRAGELDLSFEFEIA